MFERFKIKFQNENHISVKYYDIGFEDCRKLQEKRISNIKNAHEKEIELLKEKHKNEIKAMSARIDDMDNVIIKLTERSQKRGHVVDSVVSLLKTIRSQCEPLVSIINKEYGAIEYALNEAERIQRSDIKRENKIKNKIFKYFKIKNT